MSEYGLMRDKCKHLCLYRTWFSVQAEHTNKKVTGTASGVFSTQQMTGEPSIVLCVMPNCKEDHAHSDNQFCVFVCLSI